MKLSQLSLNIFYNTSSKFFQIILSLLFTPLLFLTLGKEPYGLYGFYYLLSGIINNLNFGLTPAFNREVAIINTKKNNSNLGNLLRSFEIIFFLIAMLIFFIFYFGNSFFLNWVKYENLSEAQIINSVKIMGLIISFSFIKSLFRAGIEGLQNYLVLNLITIIFLLLRFVGGFIFLSLISNEVVNFFIYLFILELFETFLCGISFYKLTKIRFYFLNFFKIDFSNLKKILPYSFKFAYAAFLWLIITESYKIILSNSLSLTEFGYLTLLLLIARMVGEIVMPINGVIKLKLISLKAKNLMDNFIQLYKDFSIFCAYLTFLISSIIVLNSEPILHTWLHGDLEAINWIKNVILYFCYAAAMVSVGGLIFALQQAFGDLSIHVKGATIQSIIFIPLTYFATLYFGITGAAIVWFVLSFFILFFWSGIIHKKFLKNFPHLNWLKEIMISILGTFITALFFTKIFNINNLDDKVIIIFKLFLISLFSLLLSSLFLKVVREYLYKRIKN